MSLVSFFVNPLLAQAEQAFNATERFFAPDRFSSQSGDPLNTGDIDANTAREGAVVPEWWGTRKRFPDKIVDTHTYYLDEWTQVSRR